MIFKVGLFECFGTVDVEDREFGVDLVDFSRLGDVVIDSLCVVVVKCFELLQKKFCTFAVLAELLDHV